MKVPEEMAKKYAKYRWLDFSDSITRSQARLATMQAFLAGYEAAKDQLADADKVMNSPNNLNGWISVKDRLPNVEKTSRSLRRESSCVLIVSYDNVYVAHLCEDWSDRKHFIFEACNCNCRAFNMEIDEWKLDQVTHWMPLPEPPKEEK